jgi:hypothetical protein
MQHDFACGTGRAIRQLRGLVREAHGYDTSATMLAQARATGRGLVARGGRRRPGAISGHCGGFGAGAGVPRAHIPRRTTSRRGGTSARCSRPGTRTGHFRLADDPDAMAAFVELAREPYFNPPPPAR